MQSQPGKEPRRADSKLLTLSIIPGSILGRGEGLRPPLPQQARSDAQNKARYPKSLRPTAGSLPPRPPCPPSSKDAVSLPLVHLLPIKSKPSLGVEGLVSPPICLLHFLSFMLSTRMPVQCACHSKGTHWHPVLWQKWFTAKPRSLLSTKSKDGQWGSKPAVLISTPLPLPFSPGLSMQQSAWSKQDAGAG